MKYAFIRSQQNRHKVQRLCEVLEVSTSGYYDWVDRPESERARENRRLVTRIRCFHQASKAIYGSPRIHEDLLESGERVGVNRVARLMREVMGSGSLILNSVELAISQICQFSLL